MTDVERFVDDGEGLQWVQPISPETRVREGLDPRSVPTPMRVRAERPVTHRPSGALVTAGEPHTGTGIMVCLRPTMEEAGLLAVEGGCPVEEHHVTLGYFGSIDEWGPPGPENTTQEEIEIACMNIAAQMPGAMQGEVSTVTVFEANPDRPMVALIDCPGLSLLYATLVRGLEGAGAEALHHDHDFTAHLTLGFDPTDDELAAAVEQCTGLSVTFAGMEVVYGGAVSRYAFGQEDDMRSAPTMAADAPTEEGDETPFDTGDEVTISGTEITGRIVDVITSGTADGVDGPIEASPESPVYLVQVTMEGEDGVAEDADSVVGATAEQLSPIEPGQAPGDGGDMGSTVAPPATGGQKARVLSGADRMGLIAALAQGLEVDLPEGLVLREQLQTLQPELLAGIGGLNAQRWAAGERDWDGVLIAEGIETGDGRLALPGSLSWRDLPQPFMAQFQNPETGGHALAIPGGSIWGIDRMAMDIVGSGFFDSGFGGREARRMMEEGTVKGCSVDLDLVTSELWFDNPDMTGTPLFVFVLARIMGATITPFPAQQEAVIYLVNAQPAEVGTIVASGAPVWHLEDQYGEHFWKLRKRQTVELNEDEQHRLKFMSITGETFTAQAVAA